MKRSFSLLLVLLLVSARCLGQARAEVQTVFSFMPSPALCMDLDRMESALDGANAYFLAAGVSASDLAAYLDALMKCGYVRTYNLSDDDTNETYYLLHAANQDIVALVYDPNTQELLAVYDAETTYFITDSDILDQNMSLFALELDIGGTGAAFELIEFPVAWYPGDALSWNGQVSGGSHFDGQKRWEEDYTLVNPKTLFMYMQWMNLFGYTAMLPVYGSFDDDDFMEFVVSFRSGGTDVVMLYVDPQEDETWAVEVAYNPALSLYLYTSSELADILKAAVR